MNFVDILSYNSLLFLLDKNWQKKLNILRYIQFFINDILVSNAKKFKQNGAKTNPRYSFYLGTLEST